MTMANQSRALKSSGRAHLWLPLAAAMLLSGCISLGAKAPDSLLTLRADASPAVNSVRTGTAQSALMVQVPSTPQMLRTTRVPVTSGGTALAYVKDAQWVEPPARMFQRLLADTISARGTRLILNDSQDVTSTGEVLTGELLAFGVDADRNQVVVTYQALRLSSEGGVIVQRRFEAREPIALVDASSTGAALNRAANRVATEVAGWMEAP